MPAPHNFRYHVDRERVLDVDIAWFERVLANFANSGAEFREGELIQAGWSLLQPRGNADGSLQLFEPDFASMPIVWVDGVTTTLFDLRRQKDVSESFFDAR